MSTLRTPSRFDRAAKVCACAAFVLAPLIFSDVALCSVESSLTAIQERLIGTILPLAAILGLVFAGFSFVMGHPQARTHLILAMFGAAIGFGAQSIVAFIRGLVQ